VSKTAKELPRLGIICGMGSWRNYGLGWGFEQVLKGQPQGIAPTNHHVIYPDINKTHIWSITMAFSEYKTNFRII